MKKTYIKGSLLVVSSLFFLILGNSCNKMLNLTPTNQVSNSQAFATKNDFDNAIRGVYRLMIAPRGSESYSSYYGGADGFSAVTGPDVLSDNLTMFSLGRTSGSAFHNFLLSGNSTTSFFQDGYSIIRAANAVLDNLGNLGTDASAANYKGQALAVRGLVYFDLMRMFAKTPANASATDLGVPLVLKVTDYTDRPKRDLVSAVYAQIETDLKTSASLISTSNGVEQMNQAAVYGLLSRLYLYEAKYPEAVAAATSALALNSNPGSISTFPSIWTDATDAGVLFKVKVTATTVDNNGSNVLIGVGYGQSSGSGDRAEYVPAYDFAALYAANDVRRNSYFRKGFFSGDSILYVKKYAGKATGNQNLVDVKLIRVAEVLLNKAEAAYRTGDEATALTALEALRSNRYSGIRISGESGARLLTAILLERRLELAFEGHRFYDLKRLNLPVLRSTTYGDQLNGTGKVDDLTTLAAGDLRFQLPIDMNTLNANTNLLQNPGY